MESDKIAKFQGIQSSYLCIHTKHLFFFQTFSFANAQTENDYNLKAQQFRQNNDFDVYQNFWYGVEIKDFEKKLLVEVHPGARSSVISLNCYLISSFLLCTTCFRMHFVSVCGRKKYVFNKQISI